MTSDRIEWDRGLGDACPGCGCPDASVAEPGQYTKHQPGCIPIIRESSKYFEGWDRLDGVEHKEFPK